MFLNIYVHCRFIVMEFIQKSMYVNIYKYTIPLSIYRYMHMYLIDKFQHFYSNHLV